jgi:hypothetical protein
MEYPFEMLQVDATLAYLADHGVSVASKFTDDHMVGSGAAAGRNDTVVLNRLWLDIEDEVAPRKCITWNGNQLNGCPLYITAKSLRSQVPSLYYDSDPLANQAVIGAMVARMEALGLRVGVYTTLTYWSTIMGNVEGYGQFPLWYPRYEKEARSTMGTDITLICLTVLHDSSVFMGVLAKWCCGGTVGSQLAEPC